MNLLTIRLILFFYLINFQVGAYELHWSETIKQQSEKVDEIIPLDTKNFFVRRSYPLIMTFHTNFKITATGKFKFMEKAIEGDHIKSFACKNKFYFLFIKKAKKQHTIYIQEISTNLEPVGAPIKVGDEEVTEIKYWNHHYMRIVYSANQNYFAICWFKFQDGKKYFAYNLFDSSSKSIRSQSHEFHIDKAYDPSIDFSLSNDGDLFLPVREYESHYEDEKRRKLKDRLVYVFNADEDPTEIRINTENEIEFRNFGFSIDNEKKLLYVTGIYSDKGSPLVSGLFNHVVNYKDNLISENFKAFPSDFIDQNWTFKEGSRLDKRIGNRSNGSTYYNYEISESELTQDGSRVGSMEQYYTLTMSSKDVTNYYYFYQDIIVYKTNSQGEFLWCKKISKKQASSNDKGRHLSYVRFIDGGQIRFIYNGITSNFNEQGEFIEEKEVNFEDAYDDNNIPTLASMELNNGEVRRERFNTDGEGWIVPKLFYKDTSSRTMLLYMIVKEGERFGILNYE